MLKKISPGVFGIAIVCFFLPFINVSCGGQKVISLSGIQLVAGTTIEQPNMFGGKQPQQKIGREPLATLAFISAIAGLFLGFIMVKESAIVAAVSGAAGVILLLLLKSKIDSEVLNRGIQVEYDVGFWLVLLSFLSAAGVNIYLLTQGEKKVLTHTKGMPNGKFCSQCGAKAEPNVSFCSECGHALK